jgi:hypothetical protein
MVNGFGLTHHKVGPLHVKSCINFIEGGRLAVINSGIDVVGTVDYTRGDLISRVKETKICGKVCENVFSAPVLKRGYYNGVWLDPNAKALLDRMDRSTLFSEQELLKPIEDFLDRVPEDLSSLGVLTDQCAVNGVAGCRFIDGMKMSTSVGLPFEGPKNKFFFGSPGNLEPGPEISFMIEQMLGKYKRGESCGVIFKASLKDEVVSKKKFETGKTREFTVAPAAFIYLQKKYFGTLVKLFQTHGFNFENSIGIDTKSIEWAMLRDYLTEGGEIEDLMAGDYKTFDKKLCAVVMMAAFEVLIQIAKKSRMYDGEEILIMRGIAHDTCYSYVSVGGDITQVNGCGPSGHALTVVINSICNSLMLRCAFFNVYPLKRFRDHVKLSTYGDDNIAGIKGVPLFNNFTVSEYLLSKGVYLVPADKNNPAFVSPYIALHECTFLKRVFEEREGVVYCPIEMATIEKLLSMYVDEGTLSHEEHTLRVANEALDELVQYGRCIFDDYKVRIDNALSSVGLLADTPSFDFRWNSLKSKYNLKLEE